MARLKSIVRKKFQDGGGKENENKRMGLEKNRSETVFIDRNGCYAWQFQAVQAQPT